VVTAWFAKYNWSAVTPHLDVRAREAWSAVIGGRRCDDLVGTVVDAFERVPPPYLAQIFGLPSSWSPWRRFSEFGLANPLLPGRAARYLADTLVPSVPLAAPGWVPQAWGWVLWHPTRIYQLPDQYRDPTAFPHEKWFFLNGVMTDDAVARLNAEYLTYLFHRPVTVIQNSTGGLGEDLLECALDKAALRTGEAATKAIPAIYDAMRDKSKTRVVLIAHSQGTIVAGVLLRFLEHLLLLQTPGGEAVVGARVEPYLDEMPLDPTDFAPPTADEIKKLELYCFANCSSRMTYLDRLNRRPWIESFANEYDLVARLGMTAPQAAKRHIRIDGPRYERVAAFGHFLNAHYLHAIDLAQKHRRRPGPARQDAAPFRLINNGGRSAVPRLYRYINGGSPARPPWEIDAPDPRTDDHRAEGRGAASGDGTAHPRRYADAAAMRTGEPAT
jgi:hypothetical protein